MRKVADWQIAHWFKAFPFVIVAINILIAVTSDFESAIRAGSLAGGWWMSSEGVWLYGGWWNVLNGLAGLFNIVCMTGWWGILPGFQYCFLICVLKILFLTVIARTVLFF